VVSCALTAPRIAGIAAFFGKSKKGTRRRAQASAPGTTFKRGFQPSDATRFDSRENFRAAVFLWMTPRATPRAISGWTRFKASAASFFFPAAIADSTVRMKLRTRLIREWLMVSRLALRRIRFLACGVFAMNSSLLE
jgi:hypothetical protein